MTHESANKVTGANSRPASQFESRGLRRRALVFERHGRYHGGAAVAQFDRSAAAARSSQPSAGDSTKTSNENHVMREREEPKSEEARAIWQEALTLLENNEDDDLDVVRQAVGMLYQVQRLEPGFTPARLKIMEALRWGD